MTFPIRRIHVARGFAVLTESERVVATGLALGVERCVIAAQLGLAISTIDSTRVRLLQKVGVRNNVELARKAIRDGFVSMHDEEGTP